MRLSGTKTNSINQYRGLGNQLWDLAGERPSLDLPFSDTKSLVDATTGSNLVTFTRASSGTFTGSNGLIQSASTDVPRFDHNPTTGESLGLLVEEARTNSHLYSEDLSNWGTPNSASVTVDATTAPDGTTTADKLVENTANSGHFLSSLSLDFSYTSGTTYVRSCWLKAGERSIVSLFFPATNFPSTGRTAVFDLATGTVFSAQTGVTASITPFPNGWYRCLIQRAATVTGSGHSGGSALYDSSGVTPYVGDGTSGAFVWGAQLEAGAFPTSYIPTTTATVTRSADVASISGSNFSSWYRQDEGTVFAEFNPKSGGGAFGFDDTTSNERIRLGHNGTTAGQFVVVDGNTVQASLTTPANSFALNTTGRVAAVYAVNDFTLFANGIVTAAPDTSGTLPTVTQSTIGNAQASTSINGTLRRLCFWPRRLPDSTLQSITQ
jgi:hypothetical protein